MSEPLILAGDIGGTQSYLALFRGAPDAPEPVVARIDQIGTRCIPVGSPMPGARQDA